MAENDYIGNIQSNRWNSLNQGYLTQTPSWMRGQFKEGPQVSTQRFRATTSGARLDWGQGNTAARVHAFGAKQPNLADQISSGVKNGLATMGSTTSKTSDDSDDSTYSEDSTDDGGSKYFDDLFPEDSESSEDSPRPKLRSLLTRRSSSRTSARSEAAESTTADWDPFS
ncbi:hypothetical protein UFOVP1130_38 [uncultured Caudovirales phage]|uniref:Uncharacterized protein n=1 Tax=uncultured Caudovirales phage TaxID=2100421 RepID=A0A6J5QS74_9CAUD|nr:hypothetical protein UFOVP1130_38 [uncultured Caudovirales phage]